MPSREEDYIDNEYYVYNRLFFRLIGLWHGRTSFKNIVYICCINFIIIFGSFEQIYFLLKSEMTLISITKYLETILPTLCFGGTYYNLLLNCAIMEKILHRIKCDWDDLSDRTELIILKKYAAVSRLCTIIIAVCFCFYITFFIFPSFLSILKYTFDIISDTELILPVHADNFMKNRMVYFFMLTVQYMIIIIVCIVGIANYSMFVAVIQHACALFNIVECRVNERFKKRSHNFYNSRSKSEYVEENEWIVGIIKYYNNAIEFTMLLKSFYEPVHLFEELLAFTFILVDYFYLFQVLTFTHDKLEKFTKLLYVVGSFFVIYVYVNLAQKLIDRNNDVFLNLCQIPFYTLSLRTQKLLLFFIMDSMRPCSISIRGAIVVSHDLFARFMRKSFSFATVLYNLQ